jgi:hypothetical protein
VVAVRHAEKALLLAICDKIPHTELRKGYEVRKAEMVAKQAAVEAQEKKEAVAKEKAAAKVASKKGKGKKKK